MNKKDLEDLEEYAELEGSEVGETIKHLISLYTSYKDYIGDNLIKDIEIELYNQLSWFRENCIIVTKEEKVVHQYKEIQYNF